jgi:coenzyme F420-reducing hydrogenase alpha subunit
LPTQLENIVADNIHPRDYQDYIGEGVDSSSFMKAPYYKPLGFPDGIYRVGPNRMEGVIRSFDPCLSCATHADGSMSLIVDLLDAEGTLKQHFIRAQ